MESSAIIEGPYRYVLKRTWDPTLPAACWVMLNPSTADAERDDPTIRKCLQFSKHLGAGSLFVVNLFAFRATNPAELKGVEDPIGPKNAEFILSTTKEAKWVIAAWGNNGRLNDQDVSVSLLLKDCNLLAMRLSKDGNPWHPLYLPLSAKPATFKVRSQS
jgi:hypothetical protein